MLTTKRIAVFPIKIARANNLTKQRSLSKATSGPIPHSHAPCTPNSAASKGISFMGNPHGKEWKTHPPPDAHREMRKRKRAVPCGKARLSSSNGTLVPQHAKHWQQQAETRAPNRNALYSHWCQQPNEWWVKGKQSHAKDDSHAPHPPQSHNTGPTVECPKRRFGIVLQ